MLATMALFLFAHLCFTNPLHVSKAAEVFGNDEIPQQRSGQRSLLDTPSGVSLRNVARGRLDLPDVPDTEKRPFRLATYYRFRPEDSQALIDVVQDELLPTVATLLSRWLRVRNPSGELNFGMATDRDGEPIPPGPDGAGVYDSDLVVKVSTGVRGSEECGTAVALGTEDLFDPCTRRPVLAQLLVCEPSIPEFEFNNMLQAFLHQMFKILGIRSNLLQTFVSAASLEDVLKITAEEDRALTSSGSPPRGDEYRLITPNAVREARLHFGCLEIDSVLMNDVTFGVVPSERLSMRHYNGVFMRSGFSRSSVHYDRQVMTDVVLGLMQDTGWYDVKYGSGGFASYGYQAGCSFVMGTFDEALADPAASRYLCPPANSGTIACFHDFSGQGLCQAQRRFDSVIYDDLYTVDTENQGNTFDCQSTPGSRCINTLDDDGDQQLLCAAGASCSRTGQVLLGGFVCADVIEPSECPPDDLMCGTPGLLTCVGLELNDCNGRGDCFEGRCFCHLGFGGDDCTVPVCTTGCADGSACPASGFCGVPECGEWSVGDTGKGTPCSRN